MKTNAFRILPVFPLMIGSALAGSIADFGARTTEPDPVLATQFNLPADTGHVVTEVFPGSPAAQLGLAKDDLVLSIDGTPASNIVSLAELVAATRTPDKEIEVGWSHGGQKSSAKVKLGEGCDRKAFTERYEEKSDIEDQIGKALSLKLGGLGGLGGLGSAGFSASVTMIDGEYSISTSAGEGDKKKVKVVRQKDKEVVFDGEVSENELDTVPEEVREKVRRALKMGGGISIKGMQGGSTEGSQPQKPEHDVSDLLKKLEGDKAADSEDKSGK